MKTNSKKNLTKEENVFPVLKLDYSFNVIYSNNSAKSILNTWNITTNQTVPTSILKNYPELFISLNDHKSSDISIDMDGTIVRCSIVAFPEAGYIGLYGYMVEHTEKIKERETVSRLN